MRLRMALWLLALFSGLQGGRHSGTSAPCCFGAESGLVLCLSSVWAPGLQGAFVRVGVVLVGVNWDGARAASAWVGRRCGRLASESLRGWLTIAACVIAALMHPDCHACWLPPLLLVKSCVGGTHAGCGLPPQLSVCWLLLQWL